MKASLIQFPWKKVEKGQGFFVPCLDTEAVRDNGASVCAAAPAVGAAAGAVASKAASSPRLAF